jgi:hypothetical protein
MDKSTSDPIDDDTDTCKKKSDFLQLSGRLITSIQWKVLIIVFVIGCLILSDVFINGVLKNINPNFVDGEHTTSTGTAMQMLFISIAYMLIDLVVKSDFL